MQKLRGRTGSPVEGADFYGREKELAYVWERLEKGNNFILPSPRRVGKTSFAKKLLEKAGEAGWETLEINLEASHAELDFVNIFIDGLKEFSWWERTKERGNELLRILQSLKPKVKLGPAEFGLEWNAQKSDIYSRVKKLLNHEQPTLIFFDELTVLLDALMRKPGGQDTVETFLHWLRSLRQVSGSKIRWIFCSSVGIENFTFVYQLGSTINDLTNYHLRSFDWDTAIGLLMALEEDAGVELNESIRKQLLDKISYLLPYFIQIVFEKLVSIHKIEGMPISEKLVERAYQEIIDEAYLNTWIERINQQYGNHQADAFRLLKYLCQRKEGVNRSGLLEAIQYNDEDDSEEHFSTLIYMLRNDGYLIEEDHLYYFRSPLLRDFWYNRYVK